jgi:ketosteroid isomerase-like protein
MASANLNLIQEIYNAFAKGDVATVLGSMSPNITWNEAEDFPYADGNPYIGPDAVASRVFARCISEWDGFAVHIEELIDAGDTIIALVRYSGTFKTTGKPQNTQAAHVWRVTSDKTGRKAIRFQQYANTLHVAQVMQP